MRIVVTMFRPLDYGAGRVVYQYLDALVEAGHSVDFVYDSPAEASPAERSVGSIVPRLSTLGIKTHHAPGFTTVFGGRSRRRIARILGTEPVDVVISTQLRDVIGAMPLAKILGSSYVLVAQNPPRFSGSSIVARLKRYAYSNAIRKADRVIGVAQEIIDELVADHGLPTSRGAAILNAVDTSVAPSRDADRERVRQELGVEPDQVLILNVGRIAPQKGQIYLATAAETLRGKTATPFVVAIAGDMTVDDSAHVHILDELTASSSRMDGDLQLLGFRDDIPSLLAAADVFVLPSIFEGGPSLAALEAMSAELPVVLADHGMRLDGFVDGDHGRYVEAADADALSEGLAEIIDAGPSERQRRGQLGREYVLNRRSLTFARAAFVAEIEAVGGSSR